MMYIPFISRLSLVDYVRVFLAFVFIIIEPILRLLFAVLPVSIFLSVLRKIWPPKETNEAATPVDFLQTTEDFVRYWGFPFEPHYVTTRDGYILCLHRIPHGRNTLNQSGSSRRPYNNNSHHRENAPTSPVSNPRPVVLLWHGFLMCSEVWVCTPEPESSLAFTLSEAGYDVWLGNTRGNKYSCKHKVLKPTDEAFWDYCIDNLAMSDFPDVVEYLLKISGAPSLTYIGFSQGTAQGFSALSLSRKLCKQVNLFVALAPATKPHALASKTVNALVNQAPEIIYLLFGHKALITSTLFWQSVLSPPLFTFVIDKCMWLLFGWNNRHIPHKNIVYRHLYSYTAVKTVVHWFQIMRTRRFQMYDEQPTIVPGSTGGHLVPKFPTESISTPLAIFYGGLDTLPDIEYILRESATPVFCMQVDEYEHLHFLWGSAVEKTVYPAVLALLNQYAEMRSDPSIRTAPWIPKSELDKALKLGRGRASDIGTVFEGRVSVEEILLQTLQRNNKAPFAPPPSYEDVAGMIQSSYDSRRGNNMSSDNNGSRRGNANPITEILSVANQPSPSNYTADASDPTSSLRDALDNVPAASSQHGSMTESPLSQSSNQTTSTASVSKTASLSSNNVNRSSTYQTMLNNPDIMAAVARLSSSQNSNFQTRNKQRSPSVGGVPQSQRAYPLVKPEPIFGLLADTLKRGHSQNSDQNDDNDNNRRGRDNQRDRGDGTGGVSGIDDRKTRNSNGSGGAMTVHSPSEFLEDI
ncbi:hypothetical protein SeLEV6574_g02724 [Synchytrium endobioticum]|uniref:Partial AB-hydrolase lipase domain-containing protein n=1 Tax=Synchytrium endobioticum TaxID=286115 RepID=A0A507D781_9FUNG|nr:hypothetical protein SeLEV6574_g02724 [Synchytrium endobioticum]